MRTVAVTGAAGALGRGVTAALAADPAVEAIVAVDRAPLPGAPARARVHELDLESDDVKRVLAGVETLVHLAWEPPVKEQPAPDRRGASLRATRALLDAAGSVGVGHLVFVSSATVYGAWPDNPVPLAEDLPLRPNPGLPLAVEKAEAERLVAEWRDDHPGVAVTVLRPAVTVGTGDVPPLGAALSGIGLRPIEATRPVQLLHRDDLVAAVVLAERERLDGTYNVAPDGWIPDETVRALAGGPARFALPDRIARALRAAGRVVGVSRPWPGTEPYAQHPWVIANDRLRAAGWAPSHSNEEAFVASGAGSRWQGLSPRRRQEVALGASIAGVGAVAAAVVALVRRSRR